MTEKSGLPHEDWPVATFSEDRRYRYTLTRRTGFGNRAVMFTMLNPSTADEIRNDSTVTRCIGFARRWGFGWLHVTNISPLRATDPRDLIAAGPEPEDIWQANLEAILKTASACDLIIVAYGVDGEHEGRAQRVMNELVCAGHTTHCLGTTKRGHPKHPLYVRAATCPIRYAPATADC